MAAAITSDHTIGIPKRVEDKRPKDILLFNMPYSAPTLRVVVSVWLLLTCCSCEKRVSPFKSSSIWSISESIEDSPVVGSSPPILENPSNTNGYGFANASSPFHEIKPIAVIAADSVRLSSNL